jgi:hypothetical protein
MTFLNGALCALAIGSIAIAAAGAYTETHRVPDQP